MKKRHEYINTEDSSGRLVYKNQIKKEDEDFKIINGTVINPIIVLWEYSEVILNRNK